ncbi:heme-binding protein [uncultured Arthrobacter sp.]|uniref:GlcG/HbpS family heme-binding protein n=1 Tax=uncultured Arthrobacter sp. TaxID=114050 RepID=UPI0025ED164E|nr:heme-binding protein [uncultured Arthrobacter sp.]
MENYRVTASITYEAAQNAVRVAIDEAARTGIAVVVTVVDPTMVPVAFGRADGATPHSVETSRRKANTAASTRRRTGWMQDSFAVELPLGTGGLLTNIRGGSPLKFGGTLVGGIGVAGGTPDQDAAIAAATLAAIGADAD